MGDSTRLCHDFMHTGVCEKVAGIRSGNEQWSWKRVVVLSEKYMGMHTCRNLRAYRTLKVHVLKCLSHYQKALSIFHKSTARSLSADVLLFSCPQAFLRELKEETSSLIKAPLSLWTFKFLLLCSESLVLVLDMICFKTSVLAFLILFCIFWLWSWLWS